MTNDLIVRQKMDLTFDEMARAAKAMANSGFFQDARQVEQAMVKVLAGGEIGLGPFAAMTGIHIIKGKPVMGANLIATLIKNDARYDYQVERLDDEGCTIAFYEDGEKVGETSFTAADAKKAGLSGDNWRKYPRNMYFARAISNGAKWFTPGIFGGATVYTPDELGADVDEEGAIIDVTPEPTGNGQKPEPVEGEIVQNGGKFWQEAHKRIGYFNAAKHAEAAASLLGIGYPQNGDEAKAALVILEQYADLRADGLGQDAAVARVTGSESESLFPDDQPEPSGAYAE